jgi:predicted transcriptional regulator
MADTLNMTQERAANRFHQIARLERELAEKQNELEDVKAQQKELTEERDGLIRRLRQAARDEGELPLFGMLD